MRHFRDPPKFDSAKELKIYPLCEKKKFLNQVIDWNIIEWGHCWKSLEEARRVVVEQYSQRMNTQSPIAYVAIIVRNDEEVMVGTFSLVGDVYRFYSHEQKNEMDHLFLSRLIVNKAYRGLGIGKYLISFAETKANEEGFDTLNLFMLSEEKPLAEYYSKLGWEETDNRTWEGSQITLMHHSLGKLEQKLE